jgi:hypothetical protein
MHRAFFFPDNRQNGAIGTQFHPHSPFSCESSAFFLDPLDLAAIHSQQTLGNALAILPRLARFCAYRQSAGNDAFAFSTIGFKSSRAGARESPLHGKTYFPHPEAVIPSI